MKPYYLLLVFCQIISINTTTAQESLWKAGNTFIALYDDTDTKLLYTASCKKYPCEALSLTKNISWKSLPKDSTLGGKNPGAVLCKEVLKQKIIYLKDLQGNENTFCLFKDKSFISSSSLSILADQNEIKEKKQ